MPALANTIILLSKAAHTDEGVADSAIYPGQAIELAADGKYDQVQSAIGEAVKQELLVAREDSWQGKTITDAYAQNDRVFFFRPLPGDRFNALIKSGQTIAIDDNIVVEGGGSGLFIKGAGTEARYHCKALEASGGALAANTHLKVRVVD